MAAGPDWTQRVLKKVDISRLSSWTEVRKQIVKDNKSLDKKIVALITPYENNWIDIGAIPDSNNPGVFNIIAITETGEQENASRRASPRAGDCCRSPCIVWGVRRANVRTLHRIQMCFDDDDTRDPGKPPFRAH
eukprot:GHVU01155497.1.p1 GENE.GHVU01155497.1~~GHVU01155497.1.p1  ORF type:complete len:134 (+),score=15.34 GHVU01155497.1:164-565(+)